MGCAPPTVVIGGVTIATNDFANSVNIVSNVSGDQGDPTLDEYDENIANGNNTANTTGVQLSSIPGGQPPTQTSLPTPSPIQAKESITTPPTVGNGTPVSGDAWAGDYNQLLSPNFTLRAFTVGAYFPNPLIDYLTYTAQERFINLQNLASNVAEQLLSKFGPFRINSGLRNVSSSTTRVSQHILGQAMDAQWEGWNYDRYWEAAIWVKDNINYDQFIFEHSDTTGLAWLHLSYKRTGNRPATDPTKVMTMYRNHYDSGLRKYN